VAEDAVEADLVDAVVLVVVVDVAVQEVDVIRSFIKLIL
jgi:hypothetical protein